MRLAKFYVTAVLLTIVSLSSFSQNTRRAFKLLEKADYEKAGELFSSAIEENSDNPAALFGQMLILADDSTDEFDLVKAWKNGSIITGTLDKLTPEELEYIGEYFYNTEARHINRPVRKKIEYAIETVEAKLIKYVREENNLELVYQVLKEFPDFKYYDNVIHIRNQLEFRKYEKMNTLEGYLEFIKKFPEAAQIEKALKYRNKLSFEKACNTNTVEAYKSYLAEFPDASEVNQAIRRLHAVAFDAAKRSNTIQAMEKFMAEYPVALEISEAQQLQKKLLYEYAKKIQTLEAYNEFIKKYPEGQFYIDIFNLKALDNGMRFLSANPLGSDNITWSRSFEEEENDELSSCLVVDSMNNYIVGGTVFRSDTGYTDAWLIKVNSEGKMIWNKYVGESFNDELSMVAVNRSNEIIGAGYTWTGIDSASVESWVFKLGADGTKLWSRRLGKIHITSLAVLTNGSIFTGGYLVNDSLQEVYSVSVMNEQGKRLWARTYTGRGRIVHINETPNGSIIMAGTGWYAHIDAKGYITSEYRFNENDSIIACRQGDKNSLNFVSIRDSVKIVLLNVDHSGKVLSEKMPGFPEIACHIRSVINGNNHLILLATYSDHQSINWIDLRTGKLTASTRLPASKNFSQLAKDMQNNLLIQAFGGEILLLKNNGLTF